ncbi:MAG TPA: zinc ribbon domain-containing protein [Gammaproteobacteria bacterium]|nr:zinc ribbon domain-containing protein [Gammaproteobacteria bacterium]
MPIYEYECAACGHRLEALQKLSEAPLTECPDCGKPALQKLISAAGFRLKGGGWYETDFKSAGKRHLADGGAEKPAGEAKPEAANKDGGEKPAAAKAGEKPAGKPASGDKAAKKAEKPASSAAS